MAEYTIEHGFPRDDRADPDGWAEPTHERRAPRRGGARPVEVVIGNAAKLRRMIFPPIRYVVPGYVAEGCTLAAGRPKLGKSWMWLEVGLAIARGGDCLGGIACEQGDVLYLALEDNHRRLQRRIDKLLGAFAAEWPAAFEYATEWPRANEGGLDRIREWVRSKANPRLVVVDVLAMFKPVRGSSESLYEADYGAIKGLQALAGEFGIAIVVVHHTRKSGTESDPFEKVSGTLGLSGAADTTLILDRDGNGATLYGRGRDIEEIESAVVFDKTGCRWHVQGEATEVRRTDERGAVLAALEDADEPMSPSDIADATRMSNQNVRQLLVSMVKAGEVTKVSRGRYAHPDHNHTPGHNDHKITKLADYRQAKTGEAPSAGVADHEVCDPESEEESQSDGAAPSAASQVCDDVTVVTGGGGTPGSQPEPTGNVGGGPDATEPAPSAVSEPDVIGHDSCHNGARETPPTAAAFYAAELDDAVESGEPSKARGTIIASEPWRRSKRTNRHIVTVFTMSAISRGVKAGAGPLVSLTDGVNSRVGDGRSITADLLGRENNTLMGCGGKWPCWIVVVDGDHTRTGYPSDPASFDAWFSTWSAKRSGKILGDWRDEARADGALDWLERGRGE